MTEKKLVIRWQDGRTMDIHLLNNPVAEYYYNCIKYLQHVDLKFNLRKNPLHPLRHNLNQILEQLIASACELDIDVDTSKLLDQPYLNYLHTIYFNSTDGQGSNDPKWLAFHDLIHSLEQVRDSEEQDSIWVDYEHLAGPLIQSFNRDWLKYSTPKTLIGTCYIKPHELGKDIWKYIRDNEPADIDVMCDLMKPWINMKPVMSISVLDLDRVKNQKYFLTRYKQQFDHWLANFQKPWTEYWKITNWSLNNESAALPIGQVDDIDLLIKCFKNEDYPLRITY